jgi:predicted RND superfamily exporter protein
MSQTPKLSVSDRVLRAIEPLIYARRKLSMSILLVLTALFAYHTLQIKSDAGFDKSIPLEHPYMQVLKQYQSDFGGANTVLVALVQKDGDIYNEKFLTRLKAVTDDVFFLKGVDRSRVSSLFTPDVRFIEVVEGGFKGGNVIPAEYQPNQAMFDLIRGNVAKGGHIGRYVSNNQRGAMIFSELLEVDPVTGEKLDYGQMAKKLEEIRQKYEDDDIKVHIVGFAKVVGDVIEATQEVVGFFIITLIMTFVLLWLYLGSIKLAILPLICSVTAVIWEFGLLRLFGYGLDPFAILVPFLILAVSVSHGVQYVNAWVGEIAENGRNAFDASLFTWRRLAIYGTFAILTDVAGFATIYLIPIDIIREMAINACFGMAAIIITNKVMMPIWLTWVSIGDPKAFALKQEKRDSIFDGLWRLLSKMVKPVPAVTAILISAVLFGWALWQGKGLQVGDSQTGVPELLPDSRFNQDFRAVNENFAIGVDILKVIAETDPDACVKFDVMDQIDRFAWHLDNIAGVQSTLSLPQAAKLVNSAFSEGNPRYLTLPRNQYVMVQAITPIPTSSGLLSPNCSAMAVFTFMRDHKAATINRVVEEVERFNKENAETYFDTHKDVDAKYCDAKVKARREVGVAKTSLQKTKERVKAGNPELSEDDLLKDSAVVKADAKVTAAQEALAGMDKACPEIGRAHV